MHPFSSALNWGHSWPRLQGDEVFFVQLCFVKWPNLGLLIAWGKILHQHDRLDDKFKMVAIREHVDRWHVISWVTYAWESIPHIFVHDQVIDDQLFGPVVNNIHAPVEASCYFKRMFNLCKLRSNIYFYTTRYVLLHVHWHYGSTHSGTGARLTKAYDVTIQRYRNLHAKIEDSKIHILRCMGSKFCVKFQRFPLKFHTKFWTHTTQNVHFTRC